MLDEFAERLELPISFDLFSRLPFQPAYRYEYANERAILTYRPTTIMVRRPVKPVEILIEDADLAIEVINFQRHADQLSQLFVAAFSRVAPVDSMNVEHRTAAANAAIESVKSGKDGELIDDASFVAFDKVSNQLVGAAIVTRIEVPSYKWPGECPFEFLPNLTWLFVSPFWRRRAIGSTLLAAAVERLSARSEPWLLSHFGLGNSGSMCFHWRHQFEVLPSTCRRPKRPT